MKTLIKWFVKKYVSVDAIKAAIHSANAALQAKVTIDDAKAKVVSVGNDAAELTAAYLSCYADDGAVSDEELAALNAKCDEMVDRYVSADVLDAAVDRILG